VKWFRRTPLEAARWVVIDCETSGLDAARDRLLSVGAVAVREGRIDLAQAFEARVKQQAPSAADNILIHGIGGDAQLAGLPLPEVISSLDAYAGDAVPVAFHAPFDAEVLRRHGFRPRARWHDLARLAPALFPGRKAKLLEDWLAEFAIPAHARHDALGDAFATAQLLLVVLAEARRQGVATLEALRSAEASGRWL
jgi:DNA polymerase III subunit epsilon